MRKFAALATIICTALLFSSCSSEEPWSYADLNALTENFSDAMYCSNLAIVANAPEYYETVEKADGSYKVYSATPNEIIRGMDKIDEITLEAPADENGNTVLDGLNADAEHLIFAYKTGESYLIFSSFCVSELDHQGRLVWDDPKTKVIEDNSPFDDLEYIKYNFSTELGDTAEDITPALFARLKAQFREEVENGATYAYVEELNWQIYSYDFGLDLSENSAFKRFEPAYTGTKKALHYIAELNPYLDEEDIKDFGKKGLILRINSHSFSSYDSSFIYDFKTDSLVRF